MLINVNRKLTFIGTCITMLYCTSFFYYKRTLSVWSFGYGVRLIMLLHYTVQCEFVFDMQKFFEQEICNNEGIGIFSKIQLLYVY